MPVLMATCGVNMRDDNHATTIDSGDDDGDSCDRPGPKADAGSVTDSYECQVAPDDDNDDKAASAGSHDDLAYLAAATSSSQEPLAQLLPWSLALTRHPGSSRTLPGSP
mgnify:CR=1 FL=1